MIFRKGFTLIELLVVVAIIGVLAAVVLAALNNSRTKGGDAVIKANLASIRSQAELIYSTSACYGDGTPITDTICVAFPSAPCPVTLALAPVDTLFANPTVFSQIRSAWDASGGGASCYSSGQAWSVAMRLKTFDGNAAPNPDSWCVDSTGASKAYTWAAGENNLATTDPVTFLCK